MAGGLQRLESSLCIVLFYKRERERTFKFLKILQSSESAESSGKIDMRDQKSWWRCFRLFDAALVQRSGVSILVRTIGTLCKINRLRGTKTEHYKKHGTLCKINRLRGPQKKFPNS